MHLSLQLFNSASGRPPEAMLAARHAHFPCASILLHIDLSACYLRSCVIVHPCLLAKWIVLVAARSIDLALVTVGGLHRCMLALSCPTSCIRVGKTAMCMNRHHTNEHTRRQEPEMVGIVGEFHVFLFASTSFTSYCALRSLQFCKAIAASLCVCLV